MTHPAGLKRFFVTLSDVVESFPSEILVDDEFVVHHLRTVMRAKAGEAVCVVDGQRRRVYQGVIQALEKRSVTLRLESSLQSPEKTLPPVTLAVALIKEQRWDWLLQKATELGVEIIQPLVSDRTVIKLDGKDIAKKLERWEAVLRSAAEQSEGLFVPRLLPPLSVSAYCQNASAGESSRILLAERGEQRILLKACWSSLDTNAPIMIAIGPEGGWTDQELDCFAASGFAFASLGQRILRSETAAIAAMAAVVYEFGA